MITRITILGAALLAATPVPAAPVPGVDLSPFGCQLVWPNNGALNTFLDRMQEAGIQWARCDAMWWGLVETTPGSYEFVSPNYPGYGGWNIDNWVTQVRAHGIEPYVILGLGNAVYDPNGSGGWIAPTSPASRAAFAAYCHACADRYKDSVDVWEIWNEPNQQQFWGTTPSAADYTQLVADAAPQVRAGDPTSRIVAGVTSGVDIGYLTTCFQNGLLDNVDVVSIHPYRTQRPESANGDFATVRSLIATYAPPGKDVAIWTGEWGYDTFYSEVDEQGQAKALTRMMINNLSQGIELSIWFSIHAFQELDSSGQDSEWGLLNRDLSRRPSFYAMKVLNERLPAPLRHIADPYAITLSPPLADQRVEVMERGDADHRTAALWLARWPVNAPFTAEPTTVTLSLTPEYELRAYDALSGDEVGLDARWSGGQVELNGFAMWDYPIYVEINRQQSPPGSNLAPAAVAHATDSDFDANHAGDKAIDGVVSQDSKWTSDASAPPHWLAIDLGETKVLTGAAISLPSLAGEWSAFNAQSVEIQTGPSLTGPWTTVASEANALQHDRIISVFGAPVAARYVRLLVDDPGIDSYARIQEFEVFGTGTASAEMTAFAAR